MDLNSTLSLLGLTTPVPSPNPGSSSGFCEICQKHVSNRTNHKFVHSHVSQVWRQLLQEFCLSRVCELRFLCVFNSLTSTSGEWSGAMVSARYSVAGRAENFQGTSFKNRNLHEQYGCKDLEGRLTTRVALA